MNGFINKHHDKHGENIHMMKIDKFTGKPVPKQDTLSLLRCSIGDRDLRGRVVKASRFETTRHSRLGFESHER